MVHTWRGTCVYFNFFTLYYLAVCVSFENCPLIGFCTFHFLSILVLLGLKLKDKSVKNKKNIIYPFRLCLLNVIKFIQGAFLTCIV